MLANAEISKDYTEKAAPRLLIDASKMLAKFRSHFSPFCSLHLEISCPLWLAMPLGSESEPQTRQTVAFSLAVPSWRAFCPSPSNDSLLSGSHNTFVTTGLSAFAILSFSKDETVRSARNDLSSKSFLALQFGHQFLSFKSFQKLWPV